MTSKSGSGPFILGYLLLAVVLCFLYLLWLGAYNLGLPPLMVAVFVAVIAIVLIVQTLLAGGLAAAIACVEKIALAAVIAQYDLAVGRPLRQLVFRSDLAIGRSSVAILADEAIRDGRLADAEAIVLAESSHSDGTEGTWTALEPLLKEMYATTNILQKCLLIHIYTLMGKKEQALSIIDQAMQEAERMWEKDDLTSQEALAEFHTNIGTFLAMLGEPQRGMALLRNGLERRTKAHGAQSEQVAKTLNSLGIVQRDAGELQAAYESLKKSKAILEQLGRKSRIPLGYVLDSLAATLVEMGRNEEAYGLARRAISSPGAGANERATRMFTLGKCLEALHKDKQAHAYYEKALKCWNGMQDIRHPLVEQCRLKNEKLSHRLKQTRNG